MSRQPTKTLQKPTFGAALAALLAVLASVLAVTPAAATAKPVPCGDSNSAPRRLSLNQMQTSEFCLINRIRTHYDLRPLVFNADLRNSAIAHSVSMVVHNYFAHEGPGGPIGSRAERAGYPMRSGSFTLGENIGGGGGRRWGSPMAVFKAWMHSPPHRENILDPRFREVGVGVARGYPVGRSAGAATYTADFGSHGS